MQCQAYKCSWVELGKLWLHYIVFLYICLNCSMDVASLTSLGSLFQCVGADMKKLVLHWDVLLFGIHKSFVLCALSIRLQYS